METPVSGVLIQSILLRRCNTKYPVRKAVD
jgi:hypothetical protein